MQTFCVLPRGPTLHAGSLGLGPKNLHGQQTPRWFCLLESEQHWLRMLSEIVEVCRFWAMVKPGKETSRKPAAFFYCFFLPSLLLAFASHWARGFEAGIWCFMVGDVRVVPQSKVHDIWNTGWLKVLCFQVSGCAPHSCGCCKSYLDMWCSCTHACTRTHTHAHAYMHTPTHAKCCILNSSTM